MKPTNILLVEDNEGDILLTTEALREGNITGNIQVVKDGWEAVNYLFKKGEYNDSSTPDLVLLDINLPKLNGHEVLRRIRIEESLKHLPVIILSTSSSENDIMDSYQNFANCYITKPIDSEDFSDVICSINKFWNSVVQLPKIS